MRSGEVSRKTWKYWKESEIGELPHAQDYYLERRGLKGRKAPEEHITFKQMLVLNEITSGATFRTRDIYKSSYKFDFKISMVSLTRHIGDMSRKGLVDLELGRTFYFKITEKGRRILLEWKEVYFKKVEDGNI